jgi:hypothetical protein
VNGVVIHPNNLIHTGTQFQTGGPISSRVRHFSTVFCEKWGSRNPARPYFLFTSVTDYFIV